MKKFALLTKSGEVINTTSAYDILNATKNFATLKNITTTDLLLIFNVEKSLR
jgi:hypothetical protein